MSSFVNDSDCDYDSEIYNEIDNTSDSDNDVIRAPDNPKTERLIESSNDLITNMNKNNYNEDMYLKQAIEESLREAEDEYIAFQLNQIKEEEQLVNLSQDESVMEEILKISLLESKKEERAKSLENIIYQMQKLKRIDSNFSIYFIELENILHKYINCEIDSYDISSEIYKNIFDELKQIRVKDSELNIIKEILTVNLH
jgi:hypothetical protein